MSKERIKQLTDAGRRWAEQLRQDPVPVMVLVGLLMFFAGAVTERALGQAHRRHGPLEVEDSLPSAEQALDPSEAVQRLDSKLSELRGELLETDRELKENRILRRMMEREDHALTELEAGRLDLRIHTLRQREEKLQVQLDDLMETRAILAAHLDITRISAETLPNVSDLPDLSIEELEGRVLEALGEPRSTVQWGF